MAITKAEILTEVNDRLSLAQTDIDTELLTVLQEIAVAVPGILQKTDTVTILINTSNIALPSDIISDVAVLDSNGVPLTRRPFQYVINKLKSSTTSGTPEYYTFFDRKIYVYPIASADTTLTIAYNHDDTNIESIGMPDEAKEAIIEGVCHKVELGKGVLAEPTTGTITHYNFYMNLTKLLQTRYRMYME